MAYNVEDIANRLLVWSEESGELLSNMKLQKLLYYEQGFHLAYFGTPLFDDDMEAWMYGPVVPSIYHKYEEFGKDAIHGDSNNVIYFEDDQEERLFDEVFDLYSRYSAVYLSRMTHEEEPWKSTGVGRGNIIEKSKLLTFFKTRLK